MTTSEPRATEPAEVMDIWDVAAHEAGHAVVFALAGYQVTGVFAGEIDGELVGSTATSGPDPLENFLIWDQDAQEFEVNQKVLDAYKLVMPEAAIAEGFRCIRGHMAALVAGHMARHLLRDIDPFWAPSGDDGPDPYSDPNLLQGLALLLPERPRAVCLALLAAHEALVSPDVAEKLDALISWLVGNNMADGAGLAELLPEPIPGWPSVPAWAQ